MSQPPPGTSGRSSYSFKLISCLGFIVVCLGLFAPQLFGLKSSLGSNPVERTSLEKSETVASGPSLGSWAPLLFGVVAIAVVGIVATRYSGKRTNTTANTNLETLASLAIDPRCVVHLVRVGERRLLVGVDWAGVKAVTELTDDASIQTPRVIGPERLAPPQQTTGLDALFAVVGERGRTSN